MKVIKFKHNYEHVEQENLNLIAIVQIQKKNKNFYNRVTIVIKTNKYKIFN